MKNYHTIVVSLGSMALLTLSYGSDLDAFSSREVIRKNLFETYKSKIVFKKGEGDQIDGKVCVFNEGEKSCQSFKVIVPHRDGTQAPIYLEDKMVQSPNENMKWHNASEHFLTATEAKRVYRATNQGEFVVNCALSHRARWDSIVQRGVQESMHMHDFYGNRNTNYNSTATSLMQGNRAHQKYVASNAAYYVKKDDLNSITNCDVAEDLSAYWAPTLYNENDKAINPERVQIYYKIYSPVDPKYIVPIPQYFNMIAGSAMPATGDMNYNHGVRWACEYNSKTYNRIPNCAKESGNLSSKLYSIIVFPQWWDGKMPQSKGQHMSYYWSQEHPYRIPQIEIRVTYPTSGDSHYYLASDKMQGNVDKGIGNGETLHADFLMAGNKVA